MGILGPNLRRRSTSGRFRTWVNIRAASLNLGRNLGQGLLRRSEFTEASFVDDSGSLVDGASKGREALERSFLGAGRGVVSFRGVSVSGPIIRAPDFSAMARNLAMMPLLPAYWL